MAKPTFQSYETQGTPYDQNKDRLALISQIAREKERESATAGILLSFQGPRMLVRYHCYETYLSDRSRVDSLYKESEKLIREFVSYLKKEYKKRSKDALSLSEIKDRRDYTVQKVSLNERYYFVAQQVYEIKD